MSKQNKNQFKNEIYKIVLDKLLLGILLVIAGFLANYLIEKYKFEEGFRTELNRTRVTRIGEVWENLYVYEASVDNIFNQFTEIVLESETDEEELERRQTELPPLIEVQQVALTELVASSFKNRFWIGEDTYTEINDYIDVLIELMDAYSNYDVDKIEELNKKRDVLRQGVKIVREKLLGE